MDLLDLRGKYIDILDIEVQIEQCLGPFRSRRSSENEPFL